MQHRFIFNRAITRYILVSISNADYLTTPPTSHPTPYPTTPTNCIHTVYPKKYANGFCFAVLCCGYTLTDLPISIRLTSLALWQSDDCPSASKATLMNMDKYFIWIHYERLHNHNKAKHNKTVCIFLGIYCTSNKNHVNIHDHESWLQWRNIRIVTFEITGAMPSGSRLSLQWIVQDQSKGNMKAPHHCFFLIGIHQ